jgi:hypothetical protein
MQCFPVHYETLFYDKALDGRLWSCVAMITGEGKDGAIFHRTLFMRGRLAILADSRLDRLPT